MSGARGTVARQRDGAPRRMLRRAVAALGVILAGLGICQLSALATKPRHSSYRWHLPQNFPMPRVPAGNPMTAAKADVGRHLFYDVRLSGNETESCATCHQQALAFSDGRARSVGSTGQSTPRGAPSLVNVAYDATLTWANPALVTLETQMQVPLFGSRPVELGINDSNKAEVLARIARDPWYRRAFRRAYPGRRRPIGWKTVVLSIAAFERSIVSADSLYDRYLRGEAKLSTSQTRGMNIFMGEKGECVHCHGSFLFSDQATYAGAPDERPKFHNDGLYNIGGTGAYPSDNTGLFAITGRPQDMGRFKAPSLRNVALTAPYMHDGSIATLQAVVAHYAAGGSVITEAPYAGDARRSPYKDPLISKIDLTERDQADLVAFLETLTDHSVIKAKRFSDPFGHPLGATAGASRASAVGNVVTSTTPR